MASKLLPMLPIKTAIELLRSIAADDKNIIFGKHAWERVGERDITPKQAIRILRTGQLEGKPEPGRNKGEWVVSVMGHTDHNRDVRVITIIISNKSLFVKTIMWKDPRRLL